MQQLKIQMKNIEDLKPYDKNPRKNDNAVDYVAKSIKEFGFKVPIVIDKNNVIVTGHTRYKASKKLGLKEVPVIVADDLSQEQIKAFRLVDNKVSEKSVWDIDLLREELLDIDDFNMKDFDFYIPENIDIDMDIFNNKSGVVKEYDEEGQTGREYNNEIIQYNIVFDNPIQKDVFLEFLVTLKKKYPNEPTQASRIIKFIKDN